MRNRCATGVSAYLPTQSSSPLCGFESPPLRSWNRGVTTAARNSPAFRPGFGAAGTRVCALRCEQIELPLVVVHPVAIVLVEHLERRAAVLRHPLRLAAAAERHGDERVARGVELPRTRARGAECAVPAELDEAVGVER